MLLHYMIAPFILTWAVILAGGWLGWQLLRQNGRILLRLDELEKRLNEIEFGEGSGEPEGLPVGSEAPVFELPDLAGGTKSLAQYRGQHVLLIFFNPECGFCRELMPRLAAVAAGFQPASEGGILPRDLRSAAVEAQSDFSDRGESDRLAAGLEARLTGRQGCLPPQILILTTGDAEKNKRFFAEHKVGCPVLLQNDGEVAKTFQAHGTPTGYLISAEGKIASELAVGADALLALVIDPRSSRREEAHSEKSEIRNPKSEMDLSLLTSAAATDGASRASRFGNRSLARSKLKRDGLKAGTPAPAFRLPRLDGRGDLSLDEFRGRRVLLVFSSPHCGPCNMLARELEKFYRANCTKKDSPSPPGGGERSPPVEVVMIGKGEPKENHAKVREHGLTFPIVLQQQWEISRRYAMFATPIAYLIDEKGVISHDVAVGAESIQTLLAKVMDNRSVAAPTGC